MAELLTADAALPGPGLASDGPGTPSMPEEIASHPRSGAVVEHLRPITLLLVDELPIVHLGVSLIAQESARSCELFWATSGEMGIEVARRERPDLVLLDPSLADLLLAEAVRRIAAVSPASRVIIFPAHVTPSIGEEAASLGVHGLLAKDASTDQFLSTVEAVARGQRMLEDGRRDALGRAAAKLNCAPLTPREHEIIRRAARGESNAEIADAIFLAPTTVKSYMQSALGKLEARNRVEAVFKLSELRLL